MRVDETRRVERRNHYADYLDHRWQPQPGKDGSGSNHGTAPVALGLGFLK